jgi:hypothetical protein
MKASCEQLIDAITEELRRIFGQRGFLGEWEEYDWLLKYYGVTEDEDICWQHILSLSSDGLEGNFKASDRINFLLNERSVNHFLARLLKKYKSNVLTYPSCAVDIKPPDAHKNTWPAA